MSFKGSVKDSLGTPIPFVNIVAVSDSLGNSAFTLTDINGQFSIKLEPARYQISLLHVSFLRKIISLEMTDLPVVRDFVLFENVLELDSVVVTYEIPIQVKNDSIIYNVDAFSDGRERKLKEVLRKLPGVEVDRNGEVRVLGEKVKEVLVEGKTFFNGGTKLAIENIPANAVKRVEVLKNHNPVDFLKGLEDNGDLSLNISLREDKKNFLFGDVDLAGDGQERYKVHPSLFYYNPKISYNALGDLNNLGEKSLSFEDFVSFQNYSQLLTNATGFFNGLNDLGDYFFNQDQEFYKEKFGAISFQKVLTPKTDLNAFIMQSNSNSNTRDELFNSFIGEGVSFDENRNITAGSENRFTFAKLNIDHKPSSGQYLNLSTRLRTTRTEKDSRIRTRSNMLIDSLRMGNRVKSESFTQSLKYDNKLSSKHTLSLVSELNHAERSPENSWDSNLSLYPIDLLEADSYSIVQNINNKQTNFSFLVKDYIVINNLNHVYVSAGFQSNSEHFLSSNHQLIQSRKLDLSDDFINDIRHKLNDLHLGLEYKFRTGKFTFKPSVVMHNFLWEVDQEGGSFRKKILVAEPQFSTKIQLRKTEELELNLSLSPEFPETKALAASKRLDSFNSVYQGTSLLNNQQVYRISLDYQKTNLIRGTWLLADLNYNYRRAGFGQRVDLQGINSIVSPININRKQHGFGSKIELSKQIKAIKLSAAFRFDYSDRFSVLNDKLILNISRSLGSKLTLETFFENWPKVEMSLSIARNSFESITNNEFFSKDLEVFIEYPPTQTLVIMIDYAYTNYKNVLQNARSKFHMAGMSVRYNLEDNPWTFELSAMNLFDIKFRRQNTFNEYYVSDQLTYVQPRIVVFEVSYKL